MTQRIQTLLHDVEKVEFEDVPTHFPSKEGSREFWTRHIYITLEDNTILELTMFSHTMDNLAVVSKA
jgi:hypothetical protein